MTDLPAYSPRGSQYPLGLSAEAPPNYSTLSLSARPRTSGGPNRPGGTRRPSRNVRPNTAHGSSARSALIRPTYTIGTKKTPALVVASDLKAHLVVLQAFHRIKEDVFHRARKVDLPAGAVSLTPEEAWRWFLQQAVYRFQVWLEKVVAANDTTRQRNATHRPLNTNDLPPLDVLMIWHSYLLHPRIYYEDGLRYNIELLTRGSFPLHEVALLIEAEDVHAPGSPGQERAFLWESRTGLPWDPPKTPNEAPPTLTISCPGCQAEIQAEWFCGDRAGWGQDDFKVTCGTCQLEVTKEAMGVAKFTEDLKKVVENPKRYTVATMLLDAMSGKQFIVGAQLFNTNLTEGLKPSAFEPSPQAFSSQTLKWSIEAVAMRVYVGFRSAGLIKMSANSALKDKPKGLQRIVGAYTVPGPFSIDLAAATRRQMKFIDKMVEIGWTEQGTFENDTDESILPLKRAVAQYHAFLDVMARNPDEFLVPTLSIDLAWHTHQLLCVEYRDTTLSLLGTIVDHDDAVEQENLAAAFDQTSKLWTTQYGIPYSICGCPVGAGSTSKSVNVSTVTSKLFGRKGKGKASTEAPAIVNSRPDLLSHTGNDVFETHPSDHTQVSVVNSSSIAAQLSSRTKASRKKLTEDQEAADSGIADGWQNLVVGLRRDETHPHSTAFCADADGGPDVVDMKALGLGECIMGIGSAGMCIAGNRKARSKAARNDPTDMHYGSAWMWQEPAGGSHGSLTGGWY